MNDDLHAKYRELADTVREFWKWWGAEDADHRKIVETIVRLGSRMRNLVLIIAKMELMEARANAEREEQINRG